MSLGRPSCPAESILQGRNADPRSEEHTSELQSLRHLVCRLLLEKKKKKNKKTTACLQTTQPIHTKHKKPPALDERSISMPLSTRSANHESRLNHSLHGDNAHIS